MGPTEIDHDYLNQLEQRIEATRRARIEYAEAEYKADREALARIQALAKGEQKPLFFPDLIDTARARPERGVRVKVPRAESESNGSSEKFSLTREIRRIIAEIDGDITQTMIREKLLERFPENEPSIQAPPISATLHRLTRLGEIMLVKEGHGSEPNVYRRVLDDPSPESDISTEKSMSD